MDIRQDNGAFAAHFGLQHNPFAAASSFQFYKPRRRVVLEQLIHFSRYSELVLAVTGPWGSGKTVLRHAMAAAGKESVLSVVVSALKSSDAAGIAQQIAYALQITHADIMSLLHAVEQSVLAGKDVHLLVDDAEALDASALLLLQRLASGNGRARCKVFLFGEPALQSMLQDMAGADGGAGYHLIELEPWTVEEAEGYVQQRLQSAGRGLDLFTGQELGALLERGLGWPGVINQQAQELLLERLSADERSKPAAAPLLRGKAVLPYRHLVALLVVAFLFIFAWYQLDDSKDKPARAGLTEPVSTSPGQKGPTAQKRVMLDLPASEPAAASRPALQPQQVAVERQAALVPPPPPVEEPVTAVPEPVVAAPVPPPAPQVAAAQQVPETPAVPPAAQPGPARAPAKPAEPPKPPKPKVAAAVAERRAATATADNWYAAQPAQGYTLQLFATASEQNARQFVQANGNQFHYFRKVHQGQQLFVVTHGRFDNATAAKAAIERLPESLRRNKPWPRTFASIRQEMR